MVNQTRVPPRDAAVTDMAKAAGSRLSKGGERRLEKVSAQCHLLREATPMARFLSPWCLGTNSPKPHAVVENILKVVAPHSPPRLRSPSLGTAGMTFRDGDSPGTSGWPRVINPTGPHNQKERQESPSGEHRRKRRRKMQKRAKPSDARCGRRPHSIAGSRVEGPCARTREKP